MKNDRVRKLLASRGIENLLNGFAAPLRATLREVLAVAPPTKRVIPRWRFGGKPPENGAREVSRRRAAIVAGRLRAENGLEVR